MTNVDTWEDARAAALLDDAAWREKAVKWALIRVSKALRAAGHPPVKGRLQDALLSLAERVLVPSLGRVNRALQLRNAIAHDDHVPTSAEASEAVAACAEFEAFLEAMARPPTTSKPTHAASARGRQATPESPAKTASGNLERRDRANEGHSVSAHSAPPPNTDLVTRLPRLVDDAGPEQTRSDESLRDQSIVLTTASQPAFAKSANGSQPSPPSSHGTRPLKSQVSPRLAQHQKHVVIFENRSAGLRFAIGDERLVTATRSGEVTVSTLTGDMKLRDCRLILRQREAPAEIRLDCYGSRVVLIDAAHRRLKGVLESGWVENFAVSGKVTAVAYQRNGHALAQASPSENGSVVRVWNLRRGSTFGGWIKSVFTRAIPPSGAQSISGRRVMCLDFGEYSSDQGALFAGCDDGAFAYWQSYNVVTAEPDRFIPNPGRTKSSILSILSCHRELITVYSDGRIRIWDCKTWNVVVEFDFEGTPLRCALNDSTIFILGLIDGRATIRGWALGRGNSKWWDEWAHWRAGECMLPICAEGDIALTNDTFNRHLLFLTTGGDIAAVPVPLASERQFVSEHEGD